MDIIFSSHLWYYQSLIFPSLIFIKAINSQQKMAEYYMFFRLSQAKILL